MKATFVLAKDPSHESTGDLTMAQLVIGLARESYQTQVICLSGRPESTADGYVRVAKPAPDPRAILTASLRKRRSLVHARFLLPEVAAAVDGADSDIFVADHCYMAEAVLAARRFREAGESALAVSTVVPEALVWKATRGVVGRLDARRIVRDELRVARRVYSLGTYDAEEARFYSEHGVRRAHWLDLTLSPGRQAAVAESGPRLVFLGDRRWAPNQEAFETMIDWWPRIAEGIPDAELCVVGARDPEAPVRPLPAGMADLGFVDDLEGMLASSRALVAPIRTGGGVRVKILDAARRGLPVVGTTAAVGSLSTVLDIGTFDDEVGFINSCRRYLQDRPAAVRDGSALYELNATRWREGRPHASVQDWLRR